MSIDRDREVHDELEAHLRMAVADRMARGQSRRDAERDARRELGNITHVKEVTREQGLGEFTVSMERVIQDIRYGLRALRRTPAFTIAAVLTLALAIGANSAVFAVVDGVLLRPLPFVDPGRLYLASYMPGGLPFELRNGILDREWLIYRDRQRSFEHVTAYQRAAYTLSGVGDAARLQGARVDASFFAVLGVAPTIGRTYTGEEERRGDKLVILSEALWRERFGQDASIIGRPILLDGVSYTVLGVMPAGFGFPARSQLWTPLDVRIDSHNEFFLNVLGRLRSGTTPPAARAELATILGALPRDPRDTHPSVAAILPLKDVITGQIAKPLVIFSSAVLFVLLIACVNVANLLLIRAAARRREMAVRMALGASRGRIARQLLTESLLVALLGGVIGVLVAQVGLRALLGIAPEGRIPRLEEVHLDWWVLAFTIGLSLLTGIAFGVLPALDSARRPPQEAMAQGGRTVGGAQARLRGVLVIAEVALALVLLTGAGLLIKSFVRMRSVDKGYDASRVMTMAVDLPALRYGDVERQRAFHTTLLRQLAAIPGVRGVGAVSNKPMGDVGIMGNIAVEGATAFPKGYFVDKMLVSPGYFATMGVRLIRGRDFASTDNANAPGVVIVSENVARTLWPGQDALGKRISEQTEHPTPDSWVTVIGVVSDVVQDASMRKHSTLYSSYLQSEWSWMLDHMTYVVRSDLGANVAPAMRAALHRVDPSVPPQQLMSMNDALLEVAAEPVFQTRVISVFAAIAILLAAIGTYGVLAYDVSERSREIALRMALGATPRDIIRMVLRRTGVLVLSGIVVGVVGSLAVTGVLTKSLYDVKPTDPATMTMVVLAIFVVALMAGWVPARRASRVDVMAALPAD
jgi:putative ABC transport system permease protein